jgi:hypothetical protein
MVLFHSSWRLFKCEGLGLHPLRGVSSRAKNDNDSHILSYQLRSRCDEPALIVIHGAQREILDHVIDIIVCCAADFDVLTVVLSDVEV